MAAHEAIRPARWGARSGSAADRAPRDVLAERNRNGQSVATVVGEEEKKGWRLRRKAKARRKRRRRRRQRQEKSGGEIVFSLRAIGALERNDGSKSHPYGFRLGYTKPWKSRWFVERDYDKLLLEDVKLKAELKDKLKSAGISAVEIERPGNKIRIIIKTARPESLSDARRGNRQAEGRAPEAALRGSLHRHPGSAQAGAGCATGVGIDRTASSKARGLPAGDAQVGGLGRFASVARVSRCA